MTELATGHYYTTFSWARKYFINETIFTIFSYITVSGRNHLEKPKFIIQNSLTSSNQYNSDSPVEIDWI